MITTINKADRLSSSDEKHIAKLDGKKTKTIKKLYKKLGSRLEFPEYFGNNLDAFADMLSDLSWLKAPHVILYIKNMEYFLSEENEERRNIITEIFIEAVTGQIEEERTFEVVKVV